LAAAGESRRRLPSLAPLSSVATAAAVVVLLFAAVAAVDAFVVPFVPTKSATPSATERGGGRRRRRRRRVGGVGPGVVVGSGGRLLATAASSRNQNDDREQEQQEESADEAAASTTVARTTTAAAFDIVGFEGDDGGTNNDGSGSSFAAVSGEFQFGQAVPLKRRTSGGASSSSSGVVVADETTPSFNVLGILETASTDDEGDNSDDRDHDDTVFAASKDLLRERRRINVGVAVVSVVLATCNFVWQYLHPVTPIQLLAGMQAESASVTVIGRNDKPTLVDFWAPWCENCKLEAPTLKKIEQEYGDRVNFVMVNGDKYENWPLVEAFGVDAIPHLALVDANGDVETALIGPVPKHILEADLDALILKGEQRGGEQDGDNKEAVSLPYTMLDVFANRPDQRRVRFDEDVVAQR